MRAITRSVPTALTAALILVGAGLVSGCWIDKEEVSSVVWSDDDTEQAYQLLLFEQSSVNTNPFVGSNRRNHRYQIFVQRPDGSGRRALSPPREGLPGGFFFYMRRAGYVLLNVIESPTVTRLDLIRTSDGSSTTFRRTDAGDGPVTPCQAVEALPSPDGATIAVIERLPPAGNGCNGGSVVVDLIDAATLGPLARFEWTLNGMPGASWSRQGDLYVWTYTGGSWRVDPETGPEPAPAPTCTQPRTSSSNLSDQGVLIGGGDTDEPVVILSPDAPNCW